NKRSMIHLLPWIAGWVAGPAPRQPARGSRLALRRVRRRSGRTCPRGGPRADRASLYVACDGDRGALAPAAARAAIGARVTARAPAAARARIAPRFPSRAT